QPDRRLRDHPVDGESVHHQPATSRRRDGDQLRRLIMIFQTLQSAGLADVAFRSVVSGITRTSTDPAIQEGEPVILASGSSADGQAVVRAVTASNAANNLWVGVAHEEIPHEGVGL